MRKARHLALEEVSLRRARSETLLRLQLQSPHGASKTRHPHLRHRLQHEIHRRRVRSRRGAGRGRVVISNRGPTLPASSGQPVTGWKRPSCPTETSPTEKPMTGRSSTGCKRLAWTGSVSPATCDCCLRAFVDAYPNRILNIHPALLPAFPGLHGQRQAWKYGVKVSGCTVHLVDLELDHGPIVIQRSVPVFF